MPADLNTPWRLMATAIYDRPRDGKVFGHMDVDVSAALAHIRRRREQGVQLTLAHLVTAALAQALAEDVSELNCYIRRGRVIARRDVGILVAVDAGDRNLAALVIRQAHQKPAAEIGQELRRRAAEKRAAQGDGRSDPKNLIGRIPWPFRKLVFRVLRWIVHDLGAPLAGLRTDTFGSALLTNIGSMGLNTGFAALMPASNVPIVLAMGRAERRPVVRGEGDDEAIVIRDVLPLTGTFDHRILDGRQAGKLASAIISRLSDPIRLDPDPEE